MNRPLRWVLTIAGVLLASGLVAVALGSWRFSRLVSDDVAMLRDGAQAGRGSVVTEEMLVDFPDPVRRYLTYTGVVGRPLAREVFIRQTGRMRSNPGQRWMPLRAKVTYTVDPPGFVWPGTMHLGLLPLARARDMYRGGRGSMLVKAGALVTVVDARGEEMDRGAMMRFLNEMAWFPTAFLGDNVSFEPIDANAARVTFTDHGRSVSGTLFIDDEGRLTAFEAKQYRTVNGRFDLEDWSTRVTAYGELGGLRLPISGTAVWKLAEGEFTYAELTFTEVRYDEVGR